MRRTAIPIPIIIVCLIVFQLSSCSGGGGGSSTSTTGDTSTGGGDSSTDSGLTQLTGTYQLNRITLTAGSASRSNAQTAGADEPIFIFDPSSTPNQYFVMYDGTGDGATAQRAFFGVSGGAIVCLNREELSLVDGSGRALMTTSQFLPPPEGVSSCVLNVSDNAIDIEIVQLDLTSVEPIIVQRDLVIDLPLVRETSDFGVGDDVFKSNFELIQLDPNLPPVNGSPAEIIEFVGTWLPPPGDDDTGEGDQCPADFEVTGSCIGWSHQTFPSVITHCVKVGLPANEDVEAKLFQWNGQDWVEVGTAQATVVDRPTHGEACFQFEITSFGQYKVEVTWIPSADCGGVRQLIKSEEFTVDGSEPSCTF